MNEQINCEVDIVRGDGEFVVSRVRRGEDLPPSLLFSPALEHQVALRLELADDLPPALGDKVQLQQVILNGIDAMNTVEDRSRGLIIRTQCSEEGVVTVRDSGIGLDSSSMEKVFAAFHTTKPGGLGMGLSISRSIVENHHGRLWVTAHDGPGASFSFTLPSHPSQSGPDV
jgi:signal transduction histidine kinase